MQYVLLKIKTDDVDLFAEDDMPDVAGVTWRLVLRSVMTLAIPSIYIYKGLLVTIPAFRGYFFPQFFTLWITTKALDISESGKLNLST